MTRAVGAETMVVGMRYSCATTVCTFFVRSRSQKEYELVTDKFLFQRAASQGNTLAGCQPNEDDSREAHLLACLHGVEEAHTCCGCCGDEPYGEAGGLITVTLAKSIRIIHNGLTVTATVLHLVLVSNSSALN
jgi:hypothetical protein